MVLLLENEIGRVAHPGKDVLGDLFLSIGEQKQLESVWGIHCEEHERTECGPEKSPRQKKTLGLAEEAFASESKLWVVAV